MPNGGPDNCGHCKFSDYHEQRPTQTFCQIRKVEIPEPMWTYCINQHTQSDVPEGPIFTSGIYEGYCRIPWNGSHEPRTYVPGKCLICDRVFEKGIEVNTDEDTLEQFCCNGHYVRWWKETYPGQELAFDYNWKEPEWCLCLIGGHDSPLNFEKSTQDIP